MLTERISRIGRDIRMAMRENTPLPESLTDLWPKKKPQVELSENLSNSELWQHYLYLDGIREVDCPEGLAGEWNRYFHEYMLIADGLSAGGMEYGKAREFLYDALGNGRKQNLSMIYLFWLEELKGYEGGSMDAWSDRLVVARRAYESIQDEKSPTYRAELMSFYVETFGDRMPREESARVLREASTLLLSKLPDLKIIVEVYHRDDVSLKTPKTKYKTHGNDMHWMLNVLRVGRDLGFTEEVQPLVDYFVNVLKVYDPALGEPYFTGYLLYFAMNNNAVPREIRDYFRGRVTSAMPAFGKEFSGQSKLASDLVDVYFDLGYYKSAFKMLKKITEQTTMLHTSGKFMEKEGEGIPDPEYIYKNIYLPLVAKKLDSWSTNKRKKGERLKELKDGKNEWGKDERHMWMLHWVLTGSHSDVETKNRIFNRDDVIAYVESGEVDSQLEMLAGQVGQFPNDSRLLKAVRERIQHIFKVANSQVPPDEFNKYLVQSGTRKAIEAEFALRKRGK